MWTAWTAWTAQLILSTLISREICSFLRGLDNWDTRDRDSSTRPAVAQSAHTQPSTTALPLGYSRIFITLKLLSILSICPSHWFQTVFSGQGEILPFPPVPKTRYARQSSRNFRILLGGWFEMTGETGLHVPRGRLRMLDSTLSGCQVSAHVRSPPEAWHSGKVQVMPN